MSEIKLSISKRPPSYPGDPNILAKDDKENRLLTLDEWDAINDFEPIVKLSRHVDADTIEDIGDRIERFEKARFLVESGALIGLKFFIKFVGKELNYSIEPWLTEL